MSFSYRSLISSISYFRSAILSRPTPKAKPVYSSGSDAAHSQHVGMNGTASQDLDPAGAFAETASFASAFEAGYVHLSAGLCKREMMGTEFRLCLRSEKLFGELFQGSLKIRESDMFVNDHSLDLMEGRGMCGVYLVGTENSSGAIIRIGSLPFSITRACTGEVWERSRMESSIKKVSCSSLAG